METLAKCFRKRHWTFLKGLANRCRKAGGRAYLVGGSVRSALLGESVEDFDLEVFGMDPTELEGLLKECGSVDQVGRSFGIYKLRGWPIDIGLPRRERKAGTGHRGFDVEVDPHMTVREAAERRDFTVNAIYFDVHEELIEDPLDGRFDLDHRVLRHCSGRFPEDPLRVLRGMQLAARLSSEVHPETVALCQELTPESLSPERYAAEWEKLILLGREPSLGLNFLKEAGWLRYFPELEALVDCPQDPRWHPEGDVWQHTLHCLDAFARKRTGDREEDMIVGLAVLCHDFGKPATTESADGGIRSHGHETAGERPARSFMEQLRVGGRIIDQVIPLVLCHMRPSALYRSKSSASAVRRLARDCGRLDRLVRVFRADSAGRPPLPDNSEEAATWLLAEARRLDVESQQPVPLIRGKDLLRLGWESGPAMGDFLKNAYELQLDGAYTSREEALKWLEAQKVGN